MEILAALQNAPVHNILIISGFILLLLAFVGRIGAVVEMPEDRQKLSGIIGALLLVTGIGFAIMRSESGVAAEDVTTNNWSGSCQRPNCICISKAALSLR